MKLFTRIFSGICMRGNEDSGEKVIVFLAYHLPIIIYCHRPDSTYENICRSRLTNYKEQEN